MITILELTTEQGNMLIDKIEKQIVELKMCHVNCKYDADEIEDDICKLIDCKNSIYSGRGIDNIQLMFLKSTFNINL